MRKRVISMWACWSGGLLLWLAIALAATAQERHDHGIPEHLGTVTFPISCGPASRQSFNRAMALLGSGWRGRG